MEREPSMAIQRCSRVAATFMERVIEAKTGTAVNLSSRDRICALALRLDEVALVNPLIDAAIAIVCESECKCGWCKTCELGWAFMQFNKGKPVARPPKNTHKLSSSTNAE